MMLSSAIYADHLMKQNLNALGFLPLNTLEKAAECDRLFIQLDNDDPCGYCVIGPLLPTVRIYQACIQYDARRWHHGLALIDQIVQRATQAGCDSISLWCASDLDANSFWVGAGFHNIGVRNGGCGKRARRFSQGRLHRQHNHWCLDLTPTLWDVDRASVRRAKVAKARRLTT